MYEKIKYKSFINSMANILLPKTKLGDYIHAYLNHVRYHKRIPKINGKRFEDRIFRIKVTLLESDLLMKKTTDKITVKEYICEKLGNGFVPETLHVFESFEDLSKFKFRVPGVLKPTHLSGEICYVDSKGFQVDKNLKDWFHRNHYDMSRERNYKNLKPRIIYEELIFGRKNVEDVKFFCLAGSVVFIQIDFDRHVNHKRVLVDRNWKSLDVSLKYPLYQGAVVKPACYEQLIPMVEKLAADFDFVRIDGYVHGVNFLFGEITHVHGAGYEKFLPESRRGRIDKLLS